MKRIQRLAAQGLLALPPLTASLALAAQGEGPKASTPPSAESASKPRVATVREANDSPILWDRLDPHAIGRAASYPGIKRRVFPAE